MKTVLSNLVRVEEDEFPAQSGVSEMESTSQDSRNSDVTNKQRRVFVDMDNRCQSSTYSVHVPRHSKKPSHLIMNTHQNFSSVSSESSTYKYPEWELNARKRYYVLFRTIYRSMCNT